MKNARKFDLTDAAERVHLNPWLGATLLVVLSCQLVGCNDEIAIESEQVASATQPLAWGAAKLGCPNSIMIALRPHIEPYYCTADYSAMLCNRVTLGPWEQFYVLDTEDLEPGTIALQSSSGYFVQALDGGGSQLRARAASAGEWERFRPGFHFDGGNRYYFRTHSNHFVVAENGGGSVMNANRTGVGDWEGFRVDCL